MRIRVAAVLIALTVVGTACEGELTAQLQRLQVLLQSPEFALEMASHLDASYYRGVGQTPPFISPSEETATVQKSVREEKIAINLAGFYAVEAGLGVISERTDERPAEILAAMEPVRGQGRVEQLRYLQGLLQSRDFALEMAAYYGGQRQSPPPFLTPEDETAMARKSVKEEKIAINLAGFYALETGGGVIAERTRELPTAVLESIVNGTRPTPDMLLLARFANATWKAGQPFRSLSRITRDTFRPAALLSEDELKKDFVQIKAAAEKLLEAMRRP
jgi:hypothetical protein